MALAAIELLRHSLQVLLDEFLDVTLVAALRPAALVVLPGLLVVMLGDLLEPARTEAVQLSLFAPDDRDDRAVPAAHERDERRNVEVTADLRAVPDRLRQRKSSPEVVEPGGEHCEALGPVSLELIVEPGCDPLEVRLQGGALLVGQIGPLGPVRCVEHGVHPRLGVTGGGHIRRVEVQAQADRAALLRSESGQLP